MNFEEKINELKIKLPEAKAPVGSYVATKIMHRHRSTSFLFNSYTDETGCKGNSCSAALNKWLKQHVSDAVIHSFRRSFRDRLRNAGVQSEMIDQLAGWSKQSVGRDMAMVII